MRKTKLVSTIFCLAVAAGCTSGVPAGADGDPEGTRDDTGGIVIPDDTGVPGSGLLIEPTPIPANAVLYNPGMGFTNFHDNAWGGGLKNTYTYQGNTYFGHAIDLTLIDESGASIGASADLSQVTLVAERSAYGWGASVVAYGAEVYPKPTTAYWRFCWSDIQPNAPADPDNIVPSDFDFTRMDNAVTQAISRGEVIALRIYPTEGNGCFPSWLVSDMGNDGVSYNGDFFPNHNNQTFIDATVDLAAEFGRRYNNHPTVDHVDIGAVGCWGEWNKACYETAPASLMPTRDSQRQLVQAYLDAFPDTPLVALGAEEDSPDNDLNGMEYAIQNDEGWRVDCWGDFGFLLGAGSWYHHDFTYPSMVQNAGDAWRRGGVHLESCGILNSWTGNPNPPGHSWAPTNPDGPAPAIDWAIQVHASVINAKSQLIPPAWMPAIYDFMAKIGYRFELRTLQQPLQASAGESITMVSTWANIGIAPHYHRRPVAIRLRDSDDNIALLQKSTVDIREWLPINDGGSEYTVTHNLTLPGTMAAGEYRIDVAILAHPNSAAFGFDPDVPEVTLAIEGLREDGWHEVSALTVN